MEPKEVNNYQLKFGQAPMASFEDFTDEADNEEQLVRTVGIDRVSISNPRCSLKASSTPRIDISRASSSSHHEDSCNSRESSPERELFAGEEPPAGCKIQLNYKEDDQDLRSSTEELDMPDPIHEQDFKREAKRSTKRRNEEKLHSEYMSMKSQERERKDSNCSEIILLNISGRTSRLSSVGSQGSGHSGKMSVASNMSSRSPSPHKCLLETSFCGYSPTQFNNLLEPAKNESEDLEKILLEREADTTKALIPSDIKIQTMGGKFKPDPLDKPRRRGREERKEFFRREVEITKKVLEQANIEVRVIRKDLQKDNQKENSGSKILKTNVMDLGEATGDSYCSMHNLYTLRRGTSGSIRNSDAESNDTKKSSFSSLFKVKHGSNFTEPESPCTCSKTRRSSLIKRKGSFDNLKMFNKCREKLCSDQSRPVTSETRSRSLFASTLGIFRKKERKKTPEGTPENEENNEKLKYSTLNCLKDKEFSLKHNKSSIEDEDKMQYSTKFNKSEKVLPSESTSMPIESPTQLLDEYDLQVRLNKNDNITTDSNNSIGVNAHCLMKKSSMRLKQVASNNSEISMPTAIDIECNEYTNPDHDDHNSVLNVSSTKRVKRRCKENQERIDISSEESIESVYVSRQKIQRKKKLICEQDQTPVQFLNQMEKENDLEFEHNSSESEKDSEIEFTKRKTDRCIEGTSDEGRSLFYEESFEEDYCVLPATLVKEKDSSLNMLPSRGRQHEIRTVPIERPRSATPINPTLLDNFVMNTSLDEPSTEKMKIFLPNVENCKVKSHRKISANTFTEFAGQVQDKAQKNISKTSRSSSIPLKLLTPQPTNWINFDEIPEKRRIPKRIQTIPQSEDEKIKTFNYVQPEECRCNCHEMRAEASMERNGELSLLGQPCTNSAGRSCSGENCISKNWSDRTSIFSDSSLECGSSFEDSPLQVTSKQSKPFSMDLDVRSNRSSTISQEESGGT